MKKLIISAGIGLFSLPAFCGLFADECETIKVVKVRAEYAQRRPFSWYYPYRYDYYYPVRHHHSADSCTWIYYNGQYYRSCD